MAEIFGGHLELPNLGKTISYLTWKKIISKLTKVSNSRSHWSQRPGQPEGLPHPNGLVRGQGCCRVQGRQQVPGIPVCGHSGLKLINAASFISKLSQAQFSTGPLSLRRGRVARQLRPIQVRLGQILHRQLCVLRPHGNKQETAKTSITISNHGACLSGPEHIHRADVPVAQAGGGHSGLCHLPTEMVRVGEHLQAAVLPP